MFTVKLMQNCSPSGLVCLRIWHHRSASLKTYLLATQELFMCTCGTCPNTWKHACLRLMWPGTSLRGCDPAVIFAKTAVLSHPEICWFPWWTRNFRNDPAVIPRKRFAFSEPSKRFAFCRWTRLKKNDPAVIWTRDLPIISRMLHQLSYGIVLKWGEGRFLKVMVNSLQCLVWKSVNILGCF